MILMTPEQIWEARARINEYHPGELREWLIRAFRTLEQAWVERDKARKELDSMKTRPCEGEFGRLDAAWRMLVRERDEANEEGSRLAELLGTVDRKREALRKENDRLNKAWCDLMARVSELTERCRVGDIEKAALQAKVERLVSNAKLTPPTWGGGLAL